MNDVVVYTRTQFSIHEELRGRVSARFLVGGALSDDLESLKQTRVLFYCWSCGDEYHKFTVFLKEIRKINTNIVICLLRERNVPAPDLLVDFVYVFDSKQKYFGPLQRFFDFIICLLSDEEISAKTEFQLGNLKLDIKSQAVLLGGQKVSTSRIEFQILRNLLENRSEIVMTEALITKIWNQKKDAHSSLYSHIYNLRKKLSLFTGSIQSIHGVGFRIKESQD